VRYSKVNDDIDVNLLSPTPGLGTETSKCSNVLSVAYPLTSLGKLVGWKCDATRAVDRNVCILNTVNCTVSRTPAFAMCMVRS
jgi:hypothetical protein